MSPGSRAGGEVKAPVAKARPRPLERRKYLVPHTVALETHARIGRVVDEWHLMRAHVGDHRGDDREALAAQLRDEQERQDREGHQGHGPDRPGTQAAVPRQPVPRLRQRPLRGLAPHAGTVTALKVKVGDRFLLCSDGMYAYFKETELPELMTGEDIDEVPKRLVVIGGTAQAGPAGGTLAQPFTVEVQAADGLVMTGSHRERRR